MEIIIVGWHFDTRYFTCKDCGKQNAAFVVSYKGEEWDSFNLCEPCSRKHTVVEDKIADVFKSLGM